MQNASKAGRVFGRGKETIETREQMVARCVDWQKAIGGWMVPSYSRVFRGTYRIGFHWVLVPLWRSAKVEGFYFLLMPNNNCFMSEAVHQLIPLVGLILALILPYAFSCRSRLVFIVQLAFFSSFKD